MSAKKASAGEPEVVTDDAGNELGVRIYLRRSVGRRAGPLYGPGPAVVPRELYDSLKLSPDLIETDAAGRPLAHTIAASVAGPAALVGTERHNAHPTIARDPDTGDPLDDDDDAADRVRSPVSRKSAEIAEHAQDEQRQGTQLAGESGSLVQERERFPQPGQTAPSREQREMAARDAERRAASAGAAGSTAGGARREARGRAAGAGDVKPLTKSELKDMDQSVLEDLARRNNVKVPQKATKKILVDRLYDARVTIE